MKLLLNLCPFCGGEPTEVRADPITNTSTCDCCPPAKQVYHVRCPDCQTAGPVTWRSKEAIDAWNRRWTGEIGYN